MRWFYVLCVAFVLPMLARGGDAGCECGCVYGKVCSCTTCPGVQSLRIRVDKLPDVSLNPADQFATVCIREAMLALEGGNYGVGACLVGPYGKILVKSHNNVFTPYHRGDLHAEMHTLLISDEMHHQGKWPANIPMEHCALYTSVEPCVMCTARVLGSGVHECGYVADDPGAGMAHLAKNLPPSYQAKVARTSMRRIPCSKPLTDLASEIYALSFTRLGKPMPAKTGERTWEQARAQAKREGKPLVTWIGQAGEDVPGCVTVTVERFHHQRGPAVRVDGLNGYEWEHYGRLTADQVAARVGIATPAQHRRAVNQDFMLLRAGQWGSPICGH